MFKKLLSLSVLSLLTISQVIPTAEAEWNHISNLSATRTRNTYSISSNGQKTKIIHETQTNNNNRNYDYYNRNYHYSHNNMYHNGINNNLLTTHILLGNMAAQTGESYKYRHTNVIYN